MAPPDRGPLGDFAEHDEDEDKKSGKSLGSARKFEEFECPACSAHNPFEPFGNGDDVLCNWCGLQFLALVDEDGNLKLKEQ
jgi:hypothetical protein